MYDVAIVGAGPAGSSCAAFCAHAGLRTLLLERERFPREKVCGDCLNPSCWPVLRRLAVENRVRSLRHGKLSQVEFIGIDRQKISIALPDDAEIAVKRSLFDELLMSRAQESGAKVVQESTVSEISLTNNWTIRTNGDAFEARVLIAADGRNSTIARLRNLLPRVGKERVALQTHIPLPLDFGDRVVLQFLPEGYSGQAPTGNDELNLCLVGKPNSISKLKHWAENEFGISRDQSWRTITPLTRTPLTPAHERLFLIGDAARVVEPFTGEGIFYALRSGELAAQAIINGRPRDYLLGHDAMYRGRLWINRLARAAVMSPRAASALLRIARHQPGVLRLLTAKVTLG